MRTLLVLLSLFILAGCSQHLGNYTALSSSNYDGKNIEEKNLVARNVSGISHCYVITVFPLCINPKLDEAVSMALVAGGGDFMSNVRIYYEWYYIPFIFGDYKYRVAGDVYKTEK